MGRQDAPLEYHQPLRSSQIADLRLAASKMSGPTRRAFEAEMTWKYCEGNPLLAEIVFGWGRHTVEVGLEYRKFGFDHRVGHCGVCHGRASLHLYVPVSCSPEIGRIRPYTMGSSADVEEAERMYHGSAFLL